MAKECKPTQDGCSRGGTGPSCSQDSKIGGAHKRQCLEEAKEQCEVALKDCLEECKKALEEKRTSTTGNSALIGGYYQRNKNPKKPTNATTIRYAAAYGVGSETPFHDVRVSSGETTIAGGLRKEAECVRACYDQAAVDCRTVQCYCGSLKCGQFDPTPGGYGSPPPASPPVVEPDEPWSEEYSQNQLSEVSFDTKSEYDAPIEIVFSRAFLPGNVVWMSEPRSTTTKSVSVSRNYATRTITTHTTTTVNTVIDMLLGLCAGPVGGLSRVYIDGALEYDSDNPGLITTSRYSLLGGRGTQKVVPSTASAVGFGRAPAYRGLCLLSCVGVSLTQKRQFPEMNVEVMSSAVREDVVTSSAPIPDKDSSIIWKVDEDAHRIYVGTTSGVLCVSSDDFGTVYDVDVPDAIEVTPLGRVVSYDGASVRLFEPTTYNAYIGSFAGSIPASQTFLYRTPNMFGNANLSLISQTAAGDTVVEEISEVYPQFPTDAVAVRELGAIDSGSHTLSAECSALVDGPTGDATLYRSIFLFRVSPGVGDSISVRELRMLGQASDNLLEDESWYEYEISPSVFGVTNTLSIFGGVVSADGSIVIFSADNSALHATKWNPRDGVLWSVNPPSVPDLGRYAQQASDDDLYKFISGSTIYSLDLSSGTVAVESTIGVIPSVVGRQYYIQKQRALIYEDANGGLTRVDIGRSVANKETVEDIVRRVATLCDIDTGLVFVDSDRTVTGYRSGSATSAANILQTILEVYQLRVTTDEAIRIRNAGDADSVAVDQNDAILNSVRERRLPSRVDQSLIIGYLSEDRLGEEATQVFTIDRDSTRLSPVEESQRSWTVLESDQYMRLLVEILAYAQVERETTGQFILPPKYLAITPGDIVGNTDGRVAKIVLGANDFLSVETVLDSVDKYEDILPVLALPSISQRAVISDIVDTIAAPMGVTTKAVFPARYGEASAIYGGMSNIDGAFDDPVLFARTNDEINATPTGQSYRMSGPLLWGRVTSIPDPMTSSAEFCTFKTHSLTIKMASADMASAVSGRVSYYGQLPDRRTVDVFYNLLVVGKELIQYGYAIASGEYVTFYDLLRCRHNTDSYKNSHAVGEVAVVYDADSCGYYEIPVESSADTVSLVGFSGGDYRRHDVSIDESDYAPCVSGYVMRKDVYTETRDLFGSVDFSGYITRIYLRVRTEHPQGLTSERTSLNYSIADSVGDLSIYAIKGQYDEALFEAERFGTSTSYIFYRLHEGAAALDEDDNSIYVSFMGRQPIYGGPTVAVNTIWDYNTEPLTIVVIRTTDFGTTREIHNYSTGIYTNMTRALAG